MEFWGIEVKSGESVKVSPEEGQLIHISQASLGEVKDLKSAKNVLLHLKIDGKDMVFGSLSGEDRPQIMCDLVFEKEFELSHGSKNASVYFLGYKADDPSGEQEFSEMSDSDEETLALPEETKAEPKTEVLKKPADKVIPEAADEDDSDDDEDSEDDDDEDSDDSGDDAMDSSDEEEEAVPQPPQPTKKRPAESPKDFAAGKKAKPNQNQNQKGSPFAGKGKGNGKPQQGGGNKFNNKGQKGKAGGQRR